MPRNLPARKDPLADYALPAVVKGTSRPVPLVATSFSVRVAGGLALVVAERTFRNAEEASIEATMTFPVPVHATLLGLRATIGDRTVVGSAQRRQKARDTYETALDSGKTAVLHEEVLRGVHMVSVGHVPPGSEIKVIATWGMPMAADDGGAATLRIPVTVGDVFGRSPLPESDDLLHSADVHEATVEVSSADGTARLRGTALLDGRARVRLDAPIDVIVSGWTPRALRGVAADGRAVALGIVPAPGGALPLDAAVLVDRSGSMDDPADGSSKASGARKASKHDVVVAGLRDAATLVRDGDALHLWEFDNTASEVRGGTFAAAVSALQPPRGGTETGRAVATVLAGRVTRDVVILTDGKSHALDIQEAARSGRRFHVVLIGEDSLEAHMGHLAALTGGQVFVASGEDSGEAIARAFAAAREPHVAAPRVTGSPRSVETRIGGMAVRAVWGPASADDAKVVGIVIPTMIEGKKFDPAPDAPAVGALVEATLDPEMGRAVAAVAAALAIPGMEQEAAAALAESEGIVCHLTSLVLVDEAGEKQDGVPAQRKVATMTPRTRGLVACLADADAFVLASAAPTGMTRQHLSARLHAGTGFSAAGDVGGSDASWQIGARERAATLLRGYVGGATAPGGTGMPGLPFVDPAAAEGRPAQGARLRDLAGRIEWSANPEALRKGDVSALAPAVTAALRLASETKEVKALAASLGIGAVAAAVALLALHDGAADRVAARVARSLLGNADATIVASARKAVGL